MEAVTLPVLNTEGKEIDKIKLDTSVFDGTINEAAIYQVVCAFRANQRKGLASTKTRGEVSGGGRKPWRQKGTGRSRQGSIRSPLWRHGGVVFGPHPRDYAYRLPKKLKDLALKSSLNAKLKENNFMVLDNFPIDKPKTKEVTKIFFNLKLNPKNKKPQVILLLLDKLDKSLKLAMRNIALLNFNQATSTHAYEILAAQKLIITKEGLLALTKRLKPH